MEDLLLELELLVLVLLDHVDPDPTLLEKVLDPTLVLLPIMAVLLPIMVGLLPEHVLLDLVDLALDLIITIMLDLLLDHVPLDLALLVKDLDLVTMADLLPDHVPLDLALLVRDLDPTLLLETDLLETEDLLLTIPEEEPLLADAQVPTLEFPAQDNHLQDLQAETQLLDQCTSQVYRLKLQLVQPTPHTDQYKPQLTRPQPLTDHLM